uniref:GGDEF domain-containing protein n=1 Tax=Nakamurella alba TaxID=2665158 RepID=UPI0018AC3185
MPNRRLLHQLIDRALEGARGQPHQAAVMFVDLDSFKPILDTFGHQTGDAVLEQVAGRLRDAVRGPDILRRVAGDEFIVLCERIDPSPWD